MLRRRWRQSGRAAVELRLARTRLAAGDYDEAARLVAQARLRDPNNVAVLDLDRAECEALVRQLPAGSHAALQANVARETEIATAFDALGAVPDVVVNNAGIVRFGPLIDQDVDDFRKVVEVNLVGTYIVAREAGRRMAKRGRGSIVPGWLNATTVFFNRFMPRAWLPAVAYRLMKDH